MFGHFVSRAIPEDACTLCMETQAPKIFVTARASSSRERQGGLRAWRLCDVLYTSAKLAQMPQEALRMAHCVATFPCLASSRGLAQLIYIAVLIRNDRKPTFAPNQYLQHSVTVYTAGCERARKVKKWKSSMRESPSHSNTPVYSGKEPRAKGKRGRSLDRAIVQIQ